MVYSMVLISTHSQNPRICVCCRPWDVDQWLREWNLLWLCGFSGAADQHSGRIQSHPPAGWSCASKMNQLIPNHLIITDSSDQIKFLSQWPCVLGVVSSSVWSGEGSYGGQTGRLRSRWRRSRAWKGAWILSEESGSWQRSSLPKLQRV